MKFVKTVGDVVKEYRERTGLTMQELAEKANVTKGYISILENNRNPKTKKPTMPTLDTADDLAKAMKMTVDELINKMSGTDGTAIPVTGMRTIPIIGRIACGKPILAEENWEGQMPIAPNYKGDFAVRAYGDSMEPKILDGDMVFIKSVPTVDDGKIAAVLIDDEVTLKVVKYINKVNTQDGIILLPLNNKYAPIILNDSEHTVLILGQYTGLQRGD